MAKREPDPDWWKSMIRPPTRKEYRQFMRSQRQQFNPLIRFYKREAGRKAADDPMVQQIQRLIGAEKGVEDIQGAYGGALDKISNLIKGTDFGAMGRSVSGAIGELGGALGVEGAGDIGAAAGRVSGIGEGEDIFSKAILGGVASSYKASEAEDIKARADRLMQLGLSKGEAEKAARAEAKDARLQLATLRGQRRAAGAVDPMERAMQFMQFGQALRDYNRSGGYGGGYDRGGGAVTDTGNDDEVGVTESEILRWLQSPTGGGYGVIGRGGLGSEGAARIERLSRPSRTTRPRGSRNPNA